MKKLQLLGISLGMMLASQVNGQCIAEFETMPNSMASLDIRYEHAGDESFPGQTFTATQTGKIKSVSFKVDQFMSPSFTAELNVLDLSGNVLGTSQKTVNGSYFGPLPFDFPTSIQVNQGQVYVATLKVISGASITVWGIDEPVYSGGKLRYYSSPTTFSELNAEDYYLHVCYDQLGTGPSAPAACGTTLNPSGVISVDPVSGTNQYRFEFYNSSNVFVSRENRSTPSLSMGSINNPKLTAGETYELKVTAISDTGSLPFVENCAITTFKPETTQLQSIDCGKTMVNNSEVITAEPVSGAEKYRFTFKSEGKETVIKTLGGSIYDFPRFSHNFSPGTTYLAEVAVYQNGVWGDNGSACEITTAGGAEGEIQNCSQVYNSWNGIVIAEPQDGGQKYHFTFVNEDVGYFSYTTTNTYVKLSRVNGLVGNTEYSVRLRVSKNGVFGPATALGQCTITTPNGSPTRSSTVFAEGLEEIFMYPNPVQEGRVYFSGTINNVEVIDMLGNTIMVVGQAESLDVSELSSGMYIIKSDEGLVRMMVK